ncbi:MAG: biopolymer transporter ExbD [Phycisphaerae bacterium]
MTSQVAQPRGRPAVVHFRPRRKRAPRELTALTLNLAPMVDVVFLLLIFFITTTTFRRAEGLLSAQLPRQGSPADEVALPISPIFVRLVETGPGPTDYSITVENFIDQPTTFNELATFLKKVQESPGFDEQTPVVIKAGIDVKWDHIVGCWNAAVRAGSRHVSFGLE